MPKYQIIAPALPNIPWQEKPENAKNSPLWRYSENPIIDRNPQKFIDTYHCTVEDFEMKQNIKIYHQEGAATRLLLPVVK